MVSNVTIFLHFSSFYDFDVWFWNCSDSVVFFFQIFTYIHKRNNRLSPQIIEGKKILPCCPKLYREHRLNSR